MDHATRSPLGATWWRALALAVLSAAALGVGAVAASAAAETTWLCRPGLASNPCLNSEETTVELDGGATFVEHAKPAKEPPIDCFYVYPTVSSQPTINANEKIEAEEIAIAESQASRFSQVCKVYAPIYPQLTIPAINGYLGKVEPANSVEAYTGVVNAFIEYIDRYNHGRGFELIGHSQGSAMLEQLIKEVIETKPALRKQLVGAIVLGGQVIVPEGKNVGGTFKTIPGCSEAGQTGCVIAYSSFLEEPPQDALFGRPTSILGGSLPEVEHPQVLCVNPTVLAQGNYAGPSLSYYPTFNAFLPPGKFPGPFLGPITQAPKAPTPWVATPAQYSAKCEARNGASWLQLTPVDPKDTRTETVLVNTVPPVPALWGQHLEDINAQLGNLVADVGVQGGAYLLTHR
ncbi:MAG TPA: DUF3089 domain-containing protein [Solirubrobacteraceae bacterium]|nr:DUF3089 domain-containing protein [Solirubrobacteraceae bacterium]